MKNLKYLLAGIFFGFVLIKGEVISWFRIQEMFHFESFHMYGVIGSAIVVGTISLLLIKKLGLHASDGKKISWKPKPFNKTGNITGGIIFGLGWALTGACPGPLFTLVGSGYSIMALALLSAIGGTLAYGMIKDKLPH